MGTFYQSEWKSQIVERIIEIRLTTLLTPRELYQRIMAETGCKYNTAVRYASYARKEVLRIKKNQYAEHIASDIERFEDLMSKNLEKGDLKEVRFCLIEICKLKGHYVDRQQLDIYNNRINVVFPDFSIEKDVPELEIDDNGVKGVRGFTKP